MKVEQEYILSWAKADYGNSGLLLWAMDWVGLDWIGKYKKTFKG